MCELCAVIVCGFIADGCARVAKGRCNRPVCVVHDPPAIAGVLLEVRYDDLVELRRQAGILRLDRPEW